MSATTPEETVYAEATRAIARQQTVAGELRSGASLLIAAAAIAISLLDERVFASAGAPLAWTALTAFVCVCVSAVAVIWPPRKVPEVTDIGAMVRSLTRLRLLDGRVRSDDIFVELTTSLASHQRLLARRTTALVRTFRAGVIALFVQFAATVAARILTT